MPNYYHCSAKVNHMDSEIDIIFLGINDAGMRVYE